MRRKRICRRPLTASGVAQCDIERTNQTTQDRKNVTMAHSQPEDGMTEDETANI